MKKIKNLCLALFFCCFSNLEAQKTIAIFTYLTQDLKAWDPDSISSGIAGSEEAVIYMSQKLANLGYKVTVFGIPPKDSPHSLESSNPRFVRSDFSNTEKFDIALSWRNASLGEALKKRAHKVYLWPHDTCRETFSEKQINAFDDVLWLSQWQRKQWIFVNPGFAKFTQVFGNGINPEQFSPVVQRENPYSCIYASNYGRGLECLLDVWPKIKKEFPRATLDIYYGWQHWGVLTKEKEQKLRSQVKELEALDVKEHGMVGHETLMEAFAKSSLWTYPCPPTEVETFCITAIRAQLSGTIPVICQHSALYETTRFGIACSAQEEYLETLRKAMRLIPNITVAERKEIGQFVLEEYTWEKLALRFKELFERPTPKSSVCLAMLTQNNGSTLKSCLDSIKDKIDSWVIVDADSSDGSAEIAYECLKDIPGEILQRESSINQISLLNELLDRARSKADYVLILDPTETLIFAEDVSFRSLSLDYYTSFFKQEKEMLIRSALPWKWSGVFDHQLVCETAEKSGLLPGIIPSQQNISSDKDYLFALHSFYLAQSYFKVAKYEEALKFLEKVVEKKNASFPIWTSLYHIGLLNELLGKDPKTIITSYMKAYTHDPMQAEPLFRLAVYHLTKQENEQGYEIAKKAFSIVKPLSPIESWIYDYGIALVLGNCAFNLAKYEEAISVYELALSRKEIPPSIQEELQTNRDKALQLKGKE